MRSLGSQVFAAAGLVLATAGAGRADVCVTIDQNRDVLSVQEQRAAVLLITTQFEQEGETMMPPCDAPASGPRLERLDQP
jgi:hypothetical protein